MARGRWTDKKNDTGATSRLQGRMQQLRKETDVLTEMAESEGGGTELPHRVWLKSHWSTAGRNRLWTRTLWNHHHGRRMTDWTLTAEMNSRLRIGYWNGSGSAEVPDNVTRGRNCMAERTEAGCVYNSNATGVRRDWMYMLRCGCRTRMRNAANRSASVSDCASGEVRHWNKFGTCDGQKGRRALEDWNTRKKCGAEVHAREMPMKKNTWQNGREVCPRRNFCGQISKTLSELDWICTEKTRGANDDPAAARKRSKLRPAVAQSLSRSDTNRYWLNIYIKFWKIMEPNFLRAKAKTFSCE